MASFVNAIPRPPYRGTRPKVIICLDVGTSHSGASLGLCVPGQSPVIRPVMKYDGYTNNSQANVSRIPTICYYDKQIPHLKASFFGQLTSPGNRYEKVWCFKLRMRPDRNSTCSPELQRFLSSPLPHNLEPWQVYSDFLEYLAGQACRAVRDMVPDLYDEVFKTLTWVISHPNGWGGAQQNLLRCAAKRAGLISSELNDFRTLEFGTEGELAFHYFASVEVAFTNTTLNLDIANNSVGTIVADLGGGTADISAHQHSKDNEDVEMREANDIALGFPEKPVYEEICIPLCYGQGSQFVTLRAAEHLSELAQNTEFNDVESLDHLVIAFDQQAKTSFSDPSEYAISRVGPPYIQQPRLYIKNGEMAIPGHIVAEFFKPSIEAVHDAITSCMRQMRHLSHIIIFFVGGFAANDYVFNTVQQMLSRYKNIHIHRPGAHTNKVVADGGVSYVLDRCVRVRVSRHHYGLKKSIKYDRMDEEHRARSQSDDHYPSNSGTSWLSCAWETILPKGEKVYDETQFRCKFFREKPERPTSRLIEDIRMYCGNLTSPKWTDIEEENFPILCSVEADNQIAQKVWKMKKGKRKSYYRADFEIALSFGTAELKAQIIWKENGIEKWGDARLVYDTENGPVIYG